MINRNVSDQKLKEIGWYIEHVNKSMSKDVDAFLKIRKNKDHVGYYYFSDPLISLSFYKSYRENQKTGLVGITAYLDKDKNEYFRVKIGSDSNNEEIYNSFKQIFESLGWKSYNDLGSSFWISYESYKLFSTDEIEETIQLIEKYDVLPELIKSQIRTACDITFNFNYRFNLFSPLDASTLDANSLSGWRKSALDGLIGFDDMRNENNLPTRKPPQM